MTCGIYRLVFDNCNKYYVGQSVNIEHRFKNHIQRLRAGTHNVKMNEAYSKYGEPILEVICECTQEELNNAEQEAFDIFRAIEDGFNIATDPSIFQEGDKNGGSKYSNSLVEDVFMLLIDPSYRYKDIAEITGVNISTVRHIANGESHLWLARKYPKEYNVLIDLKGFNRQSAGNSAKAQGKVYPKVKSPTGEIFEVECANAFARANGMDPSYFVKLLNKKANSCKGWKLA